MTISIFDCSEDAYWWVLCTEKYFKERGTSEVEKMTMAATAMRGRALTWWLWWYQRHPQVSWASFTCALLWRFKPEYRDVLPLPDEGEAKEPDDDGMITHLGDEKTNETDLDDDFDPTTDSVSDHFKAQADENTFHSPNFPCPPRTIATKQIERSSVAFNKLGSNVDRLCSMGEIHPSDVKSDAPQLWDTEPYDPGPLTPLIQTTEVVLKTPPLKLHVPSVFFAHFPFGGDDSFSLYTHLPNSKFFISIFQKPEPLQLTRSCHPTTNSIHRRSWSLPKRVSKGKTHDSVLLKICYSLLRNFSWRAAWNEGVNIHAHQWKSGVDPASHFWVSLLYLYATYGFSNSAHLVLVEMPEQVVVSWTALIPDFMARGIGKNSWAMPSYQKFMTLTLDTATLLCLNGDGNAIGEQEIDCRLLQMNDVNRMLPSACFNQLLILCSDVLYRYISKQDEFVVLATNGVSGNNNQYYQLNTSYMVQQHHSKFTIGNNNFEGLSTCQVLLDQNDNPAYDLLPGTTLRVSLRCPCPSKNQSEKGVKYLFSYLVAYSDFVSLLSEKFGVHTETILKANVEKIGSTVSNEVELLSKPDHSNVVRLSGVSFNGGYWYHVFKHAPNGNSPCIQSAIEDLVSALDNDNPRKQPLSDNFSLQNDPGLKVVLIGPHNDLYLELKNEDAPRTTILQELFLMVWQALFHAKHTLLVAYLNNMKGLFFHCASQVSHVAIDFVDFNSCSRLRQFFHNLELAIIVWVLHKSASAKSVDVGKILFLWTKLAGVFHSLSKDRVTKYHNSGKSDILHLEMGSRLPADLLSPKQMTLNYAKDMLICINIIHPPIVHREVKIHMLMDGKFVATGAYFGIGKFIIRGSKGKGSMSWTTGIFVHIALVKISKEQQWDPGGHSDKSTASMSFQFKQWDPGKLVLRNFFFTTLRTRLVLMGSAMIVGSLILDLLIVDLLSQLI